ncbi:hypothetical protein HDV06_007045 [Boothiomyces sp. JEL0866]|nr:hypothetical protein HDV06_007045 [Boothiomyces sp. JEL0866]
MAAADQVLLGSELRKSYLDDQNTVQAFGMDVQAVEGVDVVITDQVFGFPVESLSQILPGKYKVQAQMVMYDTYHRNGTDILLPVSCVNPSGENGAYDAPVGSLYSNTITIDIDNLDFAIPLSNIIEDKGSPGCVGNGKENSEYIKTFRKKSELLSRFWGRDIILEACVLLPFGWAEHSDAKYPLIISHGHYSPTFSTPSFEVDPPSSSDTGYRYIQKEYGHYLYRNWTSPFDAFYGARMIVATINHPTPFFDDSYAVNSASMGPYGDAILYELIRGIEEEYRGIGEGWARGVFGGSTGGWESLAVQIMYPDEYNGAYAACPDPISFSSYVTTNIYEDVNAYYYNSVFKKTEKPGTRDHYDGTTIGYGPAYDKVTTTVREMNYRELVLGEKSRSCGQYDIWEAAFSPLDKDGYPARIWDKKTGVINPTVAEYWKENYDLTKILERDWQKLEPKLRGKLHIYVGAMDSFFLNNAVMDMAAFFESTSPKSDAEVVIGVHDGIGFEHCFSGYEYDSDGKPLPNSITRLTYLQRLLPKFADQFKKSAPEGSNLVWSTF